MIHTWHKYIPVLYTDSFKYYAILEYNFKDDEMPTFEETACTKIHPVDMCIRVHFNNGMRDLLLLTKVSGSYSDYEGSLDEEDIRVEMVDFPESKKRLVWIFILCLLCNID